jgi:hypothetical protein
MAAKSADSARAKNTASVARRTSVAKSKAADAGAKAAMPKMVKNKVSQATIDKIKSDGMTKALAKVGAGKASATYTEGVKRMYGANRIVTAKNKGANAAKSGRSNSPYGFGGVGTPKKRGAGGGRSSATM